jgi:NAD(P)-dependent dehydrogenase (short-subunit alcohol dehydrogenase family)
MRDLRDRVAVVTGAASGIGRAMAARFARAGMRLVLADIEEEPLARVRDALVDGGSTAVAVRTDVANADEVTALASRTYEAFGTADLLCNNAGVGAAGFAWEISLGDWQWCMGVNFWGIVHGIRAFVPGMIARGRGHVVNTASLAGLVDGPGMAPYFASKHAVVSLSEALHHDLAIAAGGRVNVSVVCPSWVKTGIAASARNRPPVHSEPPRKPSSAATMMRDHLRAAVENGTAPEDVAEQVHDAVLERRFWVLTHPDRNGAIERRTQGILTGKIPPFERDT